MGSVSGRLRREELASPATPDERWHGNTTIANGGSCVAAPNGEWLLEPVVDESGVFTVDIDLDQVFAERQNFDPSGHYARPDVLELKVNRARLTAAEFSDSSVRSEDESVPE